MSNLSALGTALLVVLAIIVVPKIVRRLRAHSPEIFEVDVERDLITACHGDRAMAERLLDRERKLKPELSRTGAALMALARLRDDKR